ncbi:SPX and EXS domain-containing protein [Trifolium repens]|nr:SPX and EXS domain-containing protein [Trifolium repens]
MKNMISPIQSAVPSPTFLWRFKLTLFLIWALTCCKYSNFIFTCFPALKYSTAVPVIFLSALKYHVFPEKWTNLYRPLWILSSFNNSLYSYYWDITRDWDLSGFSRIFKFNKPRLTAAFGVENEWNKITRSDVQLTEIPREEMKFQDYSI